GRGGALGAESDPGAVGGHRQCTVRGNTMEERSTALAVQRLHARPTSEDETRSALEWLAGREGKTLSQLVQELHGAARHAEVHGLDEASRRRARSGVRFPQAPARAHRRW